MKNKLLMLTVLFTMISACSFTQEDKKVVQLSSHGKLVYLMNEYDKYEEPEDPGEPSEPEISNPMPLREMSEREMPLREMQLPEMSTPEIPARDN